MTEQGTSYASSGCRDSKNVVSEDLGWSEWLTRFLSQASCLQAEVPDNNIKGGGRCSREEGRSQFAIASRLGSLSLRASQFCICSASVPAREYYTRERGRSHSSKKMIFPKIRCSPSHFCKKRFSGGEYLCFASCIVRA